MSDDFFLKWNGRVETPHKHAEAVVKPKSLRPAMIRISLVLVPEHLVIGKKEVWLCQSPVFYLRASREDRACLIGARMIGGQRHITPRRFG